MTPRPGKYHNFEDFKARYDTNSADGVTALHAELRPHLLRSVIKVCSPSSRTSSCQLKLKLEHRIRARPDAAVKPVPCND